MIARAGYSFFVDEDMSPQTAQRLIARGYPAEHAAHRGMSGKSDREIFDYAFERGAIVITENARDFIDLCSDVELHPGVIVMRNGALTTEEEWQWLEPILDHLERSPSTVDLTNKLVEVTDVGAFRVRDLPPA